MSASMDDWYILGSGLVVTETSVDVLNRTLYDLAKSPKAALSWHRVMAASFLAQNGKEWADRVSAYNSGGARHGSSRNAIAGNRRGGAGDLAWMYLELKRRWKAGKL